MPPTAGYDLISGMEMNPPTGRTAMKLDDAFSYFVATRADVDHYSRKLADPIEVERMRETLVGSTDSVLDAFETLVRYAQFMKWARRTSSAARTLSGVTILDFLFDGPQDYGKAWFHVWKRHRHTRHASQRMFNQLERDGVITVVHDRTDDSVTCSLKEI